MCPWFSVATTTENRNESSGGAPRRGYPVAGPVATGLAGSVIHSDQEPT
jgi:hypothetical protein